MKLKYLRIIILILIGIGIFLTIKTIYTSYLMHLVDPPISQEEIAIAIIGVIISIAWYLPFFIIAYWLYRVSKKMKIKLYLIISIFVMSIIPLTMWIPSMIWIIQTEQKDPGFLIIFIASAVIILIDIIIFRKFIIPIIRNK